MTESASGVRDRWFRSGADWLVVMRRLDEDETLEAKLRKGSARRADGPNRLDVVHGRIRFGLLVEDES
ncbi:hypothetical protein [Bradyrhizobium nitroreducens]|uniref:hypothetical protein n=1 Tax=Bradyrhizobium nitroreducens TaxID=709803 RepID=UPI0011AE1FAA|nr:hypothetical protein [Bradyrhizobium nitroreducens]